MTSILGKQGFCPTPPIQAYRYFRWTKQLYQSVGTMQVVMPYPTNCLYRKFSYDLQKS